MTINERVAEARIRLARAGVQRPDADLDARLIAQWLLDWDATTFLMRGNEEEPDSFPPRYDASIVRRAGREPLAYVTELKIRSRPSSSVVTLSSTLST